MDDGSFSERDKNYYLHTQGFDLKGIERLKKALYQNFSIQSNLHKDRKSYKIYILKESNDVFLKTIVDYIQPCFYYKIHSSSKKLIDNTVVDLSHPGAEEGPKG